MIIPDCFSLARARRELAALPDEDFRQLRDLIAMIAMTISHEQAKTGKEVDPIKFIGDLCVLYHSRSIS